jgi:SPP1 family predicted phage head-tail adaptor
MRAGDLRHRVELQTKTKVKNDLGEVVNDWATIRTVWAAVEPQSMFEGFEGANVLQLATVQIRMRYRSVSPEMRAKWNEHIYDIESVVNPLENSRETILICNEVV